MASEEEQKHQSLLEYQDVRSVVSLAYMESKLTRTTLMKIDLKKVLGIIFQFKLLRCFFYFFFVVVK